jgi:tetratricopeptide (TPR) repeat protein
MSITGLLQAIDGGNVGMIQRRNWGNLKADTREFAAAEDLYRIAIRNKPDHADSYYNLARVLFSAKKQEWRDAMQEALRLDPSYRFPAPMLER